MRRLDPWPSHLPPPPCGRGMTLGTKERRSGEQERTTGEDGGGEGHPSPLPRRGEASGADARALSDEVRSEGSLG